MAYQYFVQYRHKHTGRCFEYVMYSEMSLTPFNEWLVSKPLVDPSFFDLVKVAILR